MNGEILEKGFKKLFTLKNKNTNDIKSDLFKEKRDEKLLPFLHKLMLLLY
jgi:hypothetical protein